jgi:hypothetical protein
MDAGYFKQALQVIELHLRSIRASMDEKVDLLVFDNGSCEQATSFLTAQWQAGLIDTLILSKHNLGKTGALNWILSALPNDIICYSDSDVLFRSGWLEASLAVMGAFPKPGIITAQPNFHDILAGEGRAHLALQSDERFEYGAYVPAPEIIDEYCLGIGASDELAARFAGKPLPAVRNIEQGIQAIVGASHMQFIIHRDLARQLTPLSAKMGLSRDEDKQFNIKVDELGFLHLSTLEAYVFHMGNTITDDLMTKVADVLDVSVVAASDVRKDGEQQGILFRWALKAVQNPRLKRLFMRVYDFIFRLLHTES